MTGLKAMTVMIMSKISNKAKESSQLTIKHCLALSRIVLHCIALSYIALHYMSCIVLHCTACPALHGIVLHWITLSCIKLHWLVLHCTARQSQANIVLHCLTLSCIALHCLILHCNARQSQSNTLSIFSHNQTPWTISHPTHCHALQLVVIFHTIGLMNTKDICHQNAKSEMGDDINAVVDNDDRKTEMLKKCW